MSPDREVEILLVEDNPDDAELALRALKRHNLANNVVHVSDGADALDFVFGRGAHEGRNEKPKVILLDLKLPKVGGLEVLKQLKENDTTKCIPVVILTSSKEEQDLMNGYRLGVNSYIVKPVDFEGFADAVKDIGMYWLLLNESPPPG